MDEFMGMIWNASPNFGERKLPISMLVLHYTGMKDGPSAIDWLANKESGVSAHYVVAEDGQIIHMVREEHRAHHAGVSQWRGIKDVNSASIGIEIVNPGHEWGYRAFPQEQMQSVLKLSDEICKTYHIHPQNVVGHSDIAPARKQDPGELFDWGLLASHHIAVPRPNKNLQDPLWSDSRFLMGMERYGYDVSMPVEAVVAFQRRFRPENIDGVIDGQCRAILWSLLLDHPN
ncbi:N-acetylmuramoyl-L-alanine amidase [Sphingorhabdus lutea]|uniref:N-acetylmuramoyl-L-alanine amidase n=1 Tax=Sphingorhabdus lutea TaxID=1913578 RepID=A0A1L3JBY7_9SPHN|nr:N-acetylmuramoyl-L-alanine amidase [Sphingorhabdus lutea]APG62657.1 N-acetylmuramoyl-L-alanine amidase [Sphingorhabdus lutea]